MTLFEFIRSCLACFPPSNYLRHTHLYHWPLSKSKFNLKSDRVNLVAPASPIEWLLYSPNVLAVQCKLGPERLTQLGNSNVPVGTTSGISNSCAPPLPSLQIPSYGPAIPYGVETLLVKPSFLKCFICSLFPIIRWDKLVLELRTTLGEEIKGLQGGILLQNKKIQFIIKTICTSNQAKLNSRIRAENFRMVDIRINA